MALVPQRREAGAILAAAKVPTPEERSGGCPSAHAQQARAGSVGQGSLAKRRGFPGTVATSDRMSSGYPSPASERALEVLRRAGEARY
ncbi:hypothetical protein KEM54_004849 [Ascosphaera aggregata]|nr:hypothetical protein KEM54_004849 [Ascosphaera aggregata]